MTASRNGEDAMGRRGCAVVIPTFGRERVLIETVEAIVRLPVRPDEILIVDQTPRHDDATEAALRGWSETGTIRWLRLSAPSTVEALNTGLREARAPVVLILDDDIIPGAGLVDAHASAHARFAEAWAVAGQVLQAGEAPVAEGPRGPRAGLRADLRFRFAASEPDWVANVIACNLSVKRDRALAVGGFDGNYAPPVAFRFETDFARRVLAAGGRIRFEPGASVRHLRAASGGTRATGSHLTSASPLHGAGDYYFALRWGRGWERIGYLANRPFREVRTRFHLRHPWWIPVKFIGELRALALALRLHRRGPRLLIPG